MYHKLTDVEIRALCKEKIESLEYWLRRLIDGQLAPTYGDYLQFKDSNGKFLIKREIRERIEQRRTEEPARYPRLVDAILLDDSIDIICHPDLFGANFRDPLNLAFPDGREETRTFLKRLVYPRNCLAHANPISVRQAEQVICYTNDIIDSIKDFYTKNNMNNQYNVPLIMKVIDSFGNVMFRDQLSNVHDGGIMRSFANEPQFHLRPGDVLTIEVEVDPSYDENEYTLVWGSAKGFSEALPNGKKAIIKIMDRQVGQQFDVQLRLTSKKSWHRMHMNADDFLILYYRVLPPI